ncbi:MAG: hypothetical protein ACTSP3_11500 [Candidatus Heimdallarchaeaceae archaeon]
MRHDIPPKENVFDYGTNSPHDRIVRAYDAYQGLFRCNHHSEHPASFEHAIG